MLDIFNYPDEAVLKQVLRRPEQDLQEVLPAVTKVLQAVKAEGNAAVHRISRQFDSGYVEMHKIQEQAIDAAAALISPALKDAIQVAAENIRRFHAAQALSHIQVETTLGVRCWRRQIPLDRVGIYVPGGTAPLFSTVLMLAMPASVAGCPEIILCTPPGADGLPHPAILYTAKVCGVRQVFAIGGAQAIAAMAYGTESIPRVDKILGPGNRYVTAAKMLVLGEGVAIDMPAGPSEVLVIGDETADPVAIACDLLAQAEHGSDSQVIGIFTSPELAVAVRNSTMSLLETLPRKGFAASSLESSRLLVVKDVNEALRISNVYAPEHLILHTEHAEALCQKVTHAGSVFIGPWTPESLGDYASGTNHTLPTHGFARAWSGVSLESFMKTITFQMATREGLERLGPIVETMADAEQLDAHKLAVTYRLAQKP